MKASEFYMRQIQGEWGEEVRSMLDIAALIRAEAGVEHGTVLDTVPDADVAQWRGMKAKDFRHAQGYRLRELRLVRELTQLDLARRLKIAQRTVGDLENGVTNMTVHNLIKISSALGITPELFMAYTPSEYLLLAREWKRQTKRKKRS